MTEKVYAVPLHEQLANVPRNARLVIDDADGMGTSFIPVGRMCYEAAEALRTRLTQPEPEPVAWMDAPRLIYLQVCEESDCDHSFDAHDDVSWSQDKINDSDIPYIRADTAPLQREWEILVERVRRMRDVQGMDGNWNCDPYMHGLFNGLEFALSLIEVREPKFRDAPEKWLCDQPKARISSGGGNNE